MTPEDKGEWCTDSTKLLARLPEIPHTGSYSRKDTTNVPYVKGNEIDPSKVKKPEDQAEEKKEAEGTNQS